MVDSTRSFDPHALRVRHFINLKNGIEAVPTLHAMNVHDYAFCRVQSTMCEAGDMEKCYASSTPISSSHSRSGTAA